MNKSRFVVISGGSGGLGRAAVCAFAARGYTVFSLDIRKSGMQMENIVEIETDITDSESVSRAFDVVRCKTDRISAVISLAGTYFMDSLIEVPETEFEHIFKVNVFGVYHLNRIFLPLVMAGNGRILVTTSELAGMKALPFNGIYSLTKTALEHYTDSLRQELALLGVPVIEIKPGAFDTGMIAASLFPRSTEWRKKRNCIVPTPHDSDVSCKPKAAQPSPPKGSPKFSALPWNPNTHAFATNQTTIFS